MDDLFRFLQLRPALPVAPDDVQLLVPSFVDANADRATARDRARAFISSQDFVKAGGHLSFAVAASEVARGIGAGRVACRTLFTLKRERAPPSCPPSKRSSPKIDASWTRWSP